jgi:hypothetical protein
VVKAKPSIQTRKDGFLITNKLAQSQHKKYGVSTTPENENTAKKTKAVYLYSRFQFKKGRGINPTLKIHRRSYRDSYLT